MCRMVTTSYLTACGLGDDAFVRVGGVISTPCTFVLVLSGRWRPNAKERVRKKRNAAEADS